MIDGIKGLSNQWSVRAAAWAHPERMQKVWHDRVAAGLSGWEP